MDDHDELDITELSNLISVISDLCLFDSPPNQKSRWSIKNLDANENPAKYILVIVLLSKHKPRFMILDLDRSFFHEFLISISG